MRLLLEPLLAHFMLIPFPMARQPLIRTSEFPYHVTVRANNREAFALPMEKCWSIWLTKLSSVVRFHRPKIGSFVLIPNHIHMIIWTPNENLAETMRDLLRDVGRSINLETGRINHIFGARYSWSLIQREEHFFNAYKYLYRNPIASHLCDRAELYPFSTLYYLNWNLRLPFPLYDGDASIFGGIPDFPDRIDWLNDGFTSGEIEVLRRALRRKVFQYPKSKGLRSSVQSLSNRTQKSPHTNRNLGWVEGGSKSNRMQNGVS